MVDTLNVSVVDFFEHTRKTIGLPLQHFFNTVAAIALKAVF